MLTYLASTYVPYTFGLGCTVAFPLHATIALAAAAAVTLRLRGMDREDLTRALTIGRQQRVSTALLAVLGIGLGAMRGFYLGRQLATGQPQVGYQAALVAQSTAGVPCTSAFDPAEPFIAAVYVVALALLLGPRRTLTVRSARTELSGIRIGLIA
jgi:hypothetical protein